MPWLDALHRLVYDAYFERDVLLGQRRIGALRRAHLAGLARALESRPPGGLAPLPQLDAPDAAAVSRAVLKNEAFVLRGGARDWPAVRKWSFAFFAERYGDERVFLGDEKIERKPSGTRYSLSVREASIAQLAAEVSSGAPVYLKFMPFLERFPELQADLRYDALDALREGSHSRASTGHEFYMGGAGSRTDLHTELSDIFHVCLTGKKRWVLYPPDNWLFLYPVPTKTTFVASEVDFLSPDYTLHPFYRYARGYEVVLDAGDILYLPSYTWHAVQNVEPSISVNHLWHSHLRCLRALPLPYLNCRLLVDQRLGTAEQFLQSFTDSSLPSLHG
jgi:hypothetical protein